MSIDPNETRRMVEELAESLGASRAAVFKWRSRGVPYEWQIRIVEASNKMLSFADIEALRPFRGDKSAGGEDGASSDESPSSAALPQAHEAQTSEEVSAAQ